MDQPPSLDDIFGPEDLDPELTAYIRPMGDLSAVMINHPLVQVIFYSPQLNKLANRQLFEKTRKVQQAYAEQDWPQFVWWHERPFRINAFESLGDVLTPEQYWPLLAKVWLDCENVHEFQDRWLALWQSDRLNRRLAMNVHERRSLGQRNKTLRLYRGVCDRNDTTGMSWTLDWDTALKFAIGMTGTNPGPRIEVGAANKASVLAYLTERGENEIVIDPDDVMIEAVATVTPADIAAYDQRHRRR